LLQGIIRIAIVSRNRVMTVWTPFTSVFRSLLMSPIITFMFEPAKLQMNWASASGAINLRELRSASPVARPWAAELTGAPSDPQGGRALPVHRARLGHHAQQPGRHFGVAQATRGAASSRSTRQP
jgi:hypothetical protein